MYESLKNKLVEMLKAKNPEMDMVVDDMEVGFLPPDGMKGYVNYKVGEKMCKSMFTVTNDEIELEAEDAALTPESTPMESEMESEIVNNESMDSSSAMEEKMEVTKSEESPMEVENAKTENVEAETTPKTPEAETTPEVKATEPETQTVENAKTIVEDTFDDLVEKYGYITALKIKDGTVNI